MSFNEEKWKLSIDFIMIISKYFITNKDFINIIKVCKKYKELLELFKFNPISNPILFSNIQTQYFYNNQDFIYALPNMYRYIYFGEFNKYQINKIKEINIKKQYKYNKYDDKLLIKDKLISKDIRQSICNKILFNSNFKIENKIFDLNNDLKLNFNLLNDNYYLEIFQDNDNNTFSIIRYYKTFNDIKNLTFIKILYINKNNIIKEFISNNNLNYKLINEKDKTIIYFYENNNKIEINTTFNNRKHKEKEFIEYFLNIKDINQLKIFFEEKEFKKDYKDGNELILLKNYTIYKLKPNFNDFYYNNLLNKNYNILLDSWINPYYNQFIYNLGFIKYILLDQNNNYIIYNILPTEIIITTKIYNNIKIFKPKNKMLNYISNINIDNNDYNIFNRYNFFNIDYINYYYNYFYKIIFPLKEFNINRILIATNYLTKYSCVDNNNYLLRNLNNNLIPF